MNAYLKRIPILLPLLCLIWSSSCSNSKDEFVGGDIGEKYIRIDVKNLSFDRILSSNDVDIDTNIDPSKIEIEIVPEGKEWCEATFVGKALTVKVMTNQQANKRETVIKLHYEKLSESIIIVQAGRNSSLEGLKDDKKLKIANGEASSFEAGRNIDKSFDDDFTSNYHSSWAQQNTCFPITLKYNLEEPSDLDYLIYTPRKSGTNGNFGKFELHINTVDGGDIKVGEYDFQESGSASRLSLPKHYKNVKNIKFVVTSGAGGYASCAEMEFYTKDPNNFNYLTVFQDLACTQLKKGITLTDIENISDEFYKGIAFEIFNKEYDTEFRIQSYKPFTDPHVKAKSHKTSPYSLRDNPTGIYVKNGDDLIVFSDALNGQRISLYVQDLSKGFGAGSSYPLVDGFNKFKMDGEGLIYVMYHTPTASENAIKIHFATGEVNGYFDRKKHESADWRRLLDKAKYRDFDVLGSYAHLTFPTDKFRENTPDGLALIKRYDDLVFLEQEFMGLVKYDKMFTNRMYFIAEYANSGFMYATSYRTAYVLGTMNSMTSLSELNKSPWGPAHEVGHMNQTRPGLKWLGMTEVTNNIHSLHVETSFGCTSRLIRENRYENAVSEIVKPKIAFANSTNVFHKIVPFWQLKLYLINVLGKKDVYKDLYEHYRVTPNLNTSSTTEGVYQLLFVENVCRLANLDLTEFFDQWGFLKPVDKEIDDYGKSHFTITDKQIEDLKKRVADKNYPKPKHHNIYEITDNNVASFK